MRKAIIDQFTGICVDDHKEVDHEARYHTCDAYGVPEDTRDIFKDDEIAFHNYLDRKHAHAHDHSEEETEELLMKQNA